MTDMLSNFTMDKNLGQFRPWWDVFCDYINYLLIGINALVLLPFMDYKNLVNCQPIVDCGGNMEGFDNKTIAACLRVLRKGGEKEMFIAFSSLSHYTFTDLYCSLTILKQQPYVFMLFIILALSLFLCTNVWYNLPSVRASLRTLHRVLEQLEKVRRCRELTLHVVKHVEATNFSASASSPLVTITEQGESSIRGDDLSNGINNNSNQAKDLSSDFIELKKSLSGKRCTKNYLICYLVITLIRLCIVFGLIAYVIHVSSFESEFKAKIVECKPPYEYNIAWSKVKCYSIWNNVFFISMIINFLLGLLHIALTIYAIGHIFWQYGMPCLSNNSCCSEFDFYWYLFKSHQNLSTKQAADTSF